MQFVKPRCRYVQNDAGEVVGWLMHGTGAKVYSIVSIDHAFSRWYRMVQPRLLNGAPQNAG